MVYVPNYGENWYGWGSLITHDKIGIMMLQFHLLHELIPSSDENGMAILSLSDEGLHNWYWS